MNFHRNNSCHQIHVKQGVVCLKVKGTEMFSEFPEGSEREGSSGAPTLPTDICSRTSRLGGSWTLWNISQHPASAVVQLLSCVQLFLTPWTAAHQAPLSSTGVCWSFLKVMSIESVMLSNHLILCCPFLLLPSIFPSIRVFSKEAASHIRWPKSWSFSFSISPSRKYSGLIPFRID